MNKNDLEILFAATRIALLENTRDELAKKLTAELGGSRPYPADLDNAYVRLEDAFRGAIIEEARYLVSQTRTAGVIPNVTLQGSKDRPTSTVLPIVNPSASIRCQEDVNKLIAQIENALDKRLHID